MTRVLVFDLETVPCTAMGAVMMPGFLAGAPTEEQMVVYRRAETDGKSDFLKPFMHRIVAVGVVGMDMDAGAVVMAAECGENEPRLIAMAHSWLKGGPVLVTWNGIAFDLPVLRYRAIYHRLALPFLYGRHGAKTWEKYDYRYGDLHLDLMDMLSGFGRSTPLKLAEAAALCGVPCKTDMDGGDVLARWRAQEFDAIKSYVQGDAVATARIYLRWLASTGRVEWPALANLDEQLASPQLKAAL